MALVIITLNLLGWGLLWAASGHHYHVSKTGLFGFGTGVLAYTLGMRHAFDADHIAAIDNTTRKLVNDGKRPLSVGFFFSLGHSTIVFLLAVFLSFGIRALDSQVGTDGSGLHKATNVIGTSVSGGFFYLIAALNLIVLFGIAAVYREMKSGKFDHEELERQLDNRGLMNRFFGGYAKKIDREWKMYPVGVLFGLGFDTATEVALLVLAGTAVGSGLPFWAILSLPILFAAGHEPLRHHRRLLHELRLRLGIFQAAAEGLLQPDHHGVVGLRGLLHRHHRAPWSDRDRTQPQRSLLQLLRELQHQHGGVRDRRGVRRHMGGCHPVLASRQRRGEVGLQDEQAGADRGDRLQLAPSSSTQPFARCSHRGTVGADDVIRAEQTGFFLAP